MCWAVVFPSDERSSPLRAPTGRGSPRRLTLSGCQRSHHSPSTVPISSSLDGIGVDPGLCCHVVPRGEEPALVDYWQARLRAAKGSRHGLGLRRIDQIDGDFEIVERM